AAEAARGLGGVGKQVVELLAAVERRAAGHGVPGGGNQRAKRPAEVARIDPGGGPPVRAVLREERRVAPAVAMGLANRFLQRGPVEMNDAGLRGPGDRPSRARGAPAPV